MNIMATTVSSPRFSTPSTASERSARLSVPVIP